MLLDILSSNNYVSFNITVAKVFGLNAAATTTAIAECVALIVLFRHRDRNIKVKISIYS